MIEKILWNIDFFVKHEFFGAVQADFKTFNEKSVFSKFCRIFTDRPVLRE